MVHAAEPYMPLFEQLTSINAVIPVRISNILGLRTYAEQIWPHPLIICFCEFHPT
jgi:hypothetical protein